MKKVTLLTVQCIAFLFFLTPNTPAQVTVSGSVRTMTGLPIMGATVRLVALNQTRVTDDSGFYDFSKPTGAHTFETPATGLLSLDFRGKQLILSLYRQEKVSLELFDVSGKLVRSVPQQTLDAGNNAIDLGMPDNTSTIFIAKVKVNSITTCCRFAAVGKMFVGAKEGVSQQHDRLTLSKFARVLAVDSIVVTHPNYWGGLDFINARKIKADTGLNNFRMFSNDTSSTGWYASAMNFIFTPDAIGVSYYKQKVPDFLFEERETQREMEQSFYRFPSEVPSNKKWATYNCNINGTVTTDVATTGGNTLNFNPKYINNNTWWEILGVQHHEMSHSYQQYYSTTGADGFGEAIPDAARCLTGFFYWPAGAKCSGGFAQAYQVGGRYWYFIELKHPGFIYKIMSSANTGDISTRVQTITGESLASLCTECETKGMPYTLGRGSF
jgi:hypothetical protein